MKKIIIYILLFSYSIITVKPFLPIITDVVAHIFWYSEHIATVHNEKGKYHVHYESLVERQKNDSEKKAPITKIEIISTEHLMNTSFYDFAYKLSLPLHFTNLSLYFPHIWLTNSYPPPKII